MERRQWRSSMEKINIMITSVGRRVSLVKNFQKYSNVFCCDMNPHLSAAAQIADNFFKVPKTTETDYLDILLNICKKNDIKIIIPTIDTELSVISRAKERFLQEGVFIAVSSPKICDTFYLKSSTEKFFIQNGFNTPKIIKKLKNAKYPIFAKLDNSSSSIGAVRINSYEVAKELKGNYIFQEYITGKEYTVDTFFDKNGKIKCIVPRERIEVRAGEVSKAKTCKDIEIIQEIKRLEPFLQGSYGCLTIQLFKSNNKLYFIEINPRFGGGYPLSWLSGADYAKMLLDDYFGKKLKYFDSWNDNLIMLRYDAEVLVDDSDI